MSTGSGKSAIYQIAGLLPDWGEGIVQRYDDDSVVVLFDDVGYKTLALAVVLERSLLSAGRLTSGCRSCPGLRGRGRSPVASSRG